MASVYYGEENFPALCKLMRAADKASIYEGIIFGMILFLGAGYVPYVYGIDEPELIKLCGNAVRILSSTLVFSSVLYLYETYLMIPGKIFIVTFSAFLRHIVLILVFAVPLGKLFGLNGIWTGFAAAPVLTLVICVLLEWKLYGKEKFPLYLYGSRCTADYDFYLAPESIIAVRDKAGKF